MKRLLILSIVLLVFRPIGVISQMEMVGELSREEILQNFPDWQEIVASYSSNQQAIQKLKEVNQKIQIEIYLGTWCPDSKAHVSAYFKVVDAVANPLIMTTYTGLPRNKEARKEFIQGKGITRLPTFIVYRDGTEIGRIIETPTNSVEEDLAEIINK